jgi:23S rRNA (cytosine1962-C5)-methyltransferase
MAEYAGAVTVRKGRERRLATGHSWLYSNEVEHPRPRPSPGSLVRVEDHHGRFLATAAYHPNALICGRIWSRDPDESVGADLVRRRLQAAAARRRALVPRWEAFRLVHAEADDLPGLVVDRYGTLAVVQSTSAFTDTLCGTVAEMLAVELGCEAVILRNDARGRRFEDLPERVEALVGPAVTDHVVQEGGAAVGFDPMGGQKTGLFLDMRSNRDRIVDWAEGRRVLDLYSYVGTIGVRAALAGAAEVTCVDSSPAACARIEGNAAANGVQVRATEGDVQDVLKGIPPGSMDLVVFDPPGLIQSKKDVSKGVNKLRRLTYLALRAVAPGGLFVSASCSYHLTRETHAEVVAGAAGRQGRVVRRIYRGGASPDHPLLPAHPQTDYLDCMAFWVEGHPRGS